MQPEEHEWHHITHCTDCDDSGIIWQEVREPSYPGSVASTRWVRDEAQACLKCPEGENMKEFLDT